MMEDSVGALPPLWTVTRLPPNCCMAMRNETLERRVEIETPEQTVLSYTIAGVGSRAAAALVDLLHHWSASS